MPTRLELIDADLFRRMLGDCIDHQHKQIGRHVHCVPCGRRLYPGRVMTAEELAAAKAAMAL